MTKILRITMLLFILTLSANSFCQAKWIDVGIKNGRPVSYNSDIEYVPDSEQTKAIFWTKIDISPDDPVANKMPGLKTLITASYFDFTTQKYAHFIDIFYDNNGNIIKANNINPVTFVPIDKLSLIGRIYDIVYKSI